MGARRARPRCGGDGSVNPVAAGADAAAHIDTARLAAHIESVRLALAAVDDPEMPGVSIVDLGLLESIECDDDGRVVIGLIPTFSGCPALDVIREDVRRAVAALDCVTHVE